MTTKMQHTLYIWLLAGFCLVSTSMAQGFGTPEQRAERAKAQIETMVERLGLEGEKADQVRQILTVQSEEQGAIFEAYAGQRDRNARGMMRQEMQDLQAMTSEKLSGVLSEEEMDVYKKAIAEAQERRRQRGGGRGQGGNPNSN